MKAAGHVVVHFGIVLVARQGPLQEGEIVAPEAGLPPGGDDQGGQEEGHEASQGGAVLNHATRPNRSAAAKTIIHNSPICGK